MKEPCIRNFRRKGSGKYDALLLIYSLFCFTLSFHLISCHETTSDNYDRPEANRFELTDLVSNLNEPMELDFLSSDQVIFIERKGIESLRSKRKHCGKYSIPEQK